MRLIKFNRTTHYSLGILCLCMAGTVGLGQEADPSNPNELLLKDYHPQSIYQIPQTSIDRARFPVIDMHTHVYAKTPPQIAA